MIITDLVDLGLAIAFAVVALAVAAILRLRTKPPRDATSAVSGTEETKLRYSMI